MLYQHINITITLSYDIFYAKKPQLLTTSRPRNVKNTIFAKLSPSPNPSFSWGLRWLYFQLIQPPTHPFSCTVRARGHKESASPNMHYFSILINTVSLLRSKNTIFVIKTLLSCNFLHAPPALSLDFLRPTKESAGL